MCSVTCFSQKGEKRIKDSTGHILYEGGSGVFLNLKGDTLTISYNSSEIDEPYSRKRDTVPVILIVINTNTGINSTMGFFHPLDKAQNDRRMPYWVRGYSVKELHNTSEGVIDAGGVSCVDQNGNIVNCYHDYWEHIQYLDEDKKPFGKSIIVWDSKEIKN